jgi:AcrR family transcriptional regulator
MIHILQQVKWAEDPTPDGVLPVKQRRGIETRDKLMSAGKRLIARRDFDSMSVAEIAEAAGCSVGAFYQRFRDKDAFFGALIAQYVSDGRATTLALYAEHDDDRLIAALVAATARRFRENTGLLRAAIRKRMEEAALWDPIRRLGHFAADCFIAWRGARRGRPLDADEAIATRFAFQVLYGTLNNAVINQPGPLDLEDDDFVVQLERAFRLVLLAGDAAPALEPASKTRDAI